MHTQYELKPKGQLKINDTNAFVDDSLNQNVIGHCFLQGQDNFREQRYADEYPPSINNNSTNLYGQQIQTLMSANHFNMQSIQPYQQNLQNGLDCHQVGPEQIISSMNGSQRHQTYETITFAQNNQNTYQTLERINETDEGPDSRLNPSQLSSVSKEEGVLQIINDNFTNFFNVPPPQSDSSSLFVNNKDETEKNDHFHNKYHRDMLEIDKKTIINCKQSSIPQEGKTHIQIRNEGNITSSYQGEFNTRQLHVLRELVKEEYIKPINPKGRVNNDGESLVPQVNLYKEKTSNEWEREEFKRSETEMLHLQIFNKSENNLKAQELERDQFSSRFRTQQIQQDVSSDIFSEGYSYRTQNSHIENRKKSSSGLQGIQGKAHGILQEIKLNGTSIEELKESSKSEDGHLNQQSSSEQTKYNGSFLNQNVISGQECNICPVINAELVENPIKRIRILSQNPSRSANIQPLQSSQEYGQKMMANVDENIIKTQPQSMQNPISCTEAPSKPLAMEYHQQVNSELKENNYEDISQGITTHSLNMSINSGLKTNGDCSNVCQSFEKKFKKLRSNSHENRRSYPNRDTFLNISVEEGEYDRNKLNQNSLHDKNKVISQELKTDRLDEQFDAQNIYNQNSMYKRNNLRLNESIDFNKSESEKARKEHLDSINSQEILKGLIQNGKKHSADLIERRKNQQPVCPQNEESSPDERDTPVLSQHIDCLDRTFKRTQQEQFIGQNKNGKGIARTHDKGNENQMSGSEDKGKEKQSNRNKKNKSLTEEAIQCDIRSSVSNYLLQDISADNSIISEMNLNSQGDKFEFQGSKGFRFEEDGEHNMRYISKDYAEKSIEVTNKFDYKKENEELFEFQLDEEDVLQQEGDEAFQFQFGDTRIEGGIDLLLNLEQPEAQFGSVSIDTLRVFAGSPSKNIPLEQKFRHNHNSIPIKSLETSFNPNLNQNEELFEILDEEASFSESEIGKRYLMSSPETELSEDEGFDVIHENKFSKRSPNYSFLKQLGDEDIKYRFPPQQPNEDKLALNRQEEQYFENKFYQSNAGKCSYQFSEYFRSNCLVRSQSGDDEMPPQTTESLQKSTLLKEKQNKQLELLKIMHMLEDDPKHMQMLKQVQKQSNETNVSQKSKQNINYPINSYQNHRKEKKQQESLGKENVVPDHLINLMELMQKKLDHLEDKLSQPQQKKSLQTLQEQGINIKINFNTPNSITGGVDQSNQSNKVEPKEFAKFFQRQQSDQVNYQPNKQVTVKNMGNHSKSCISQRQKHNNSKEKQKDVQQTQRQKTHEKITQLYNLHKKSILLQDKIHKELDTHSILNGKKSRNQETKYKVKDSSMNRYPQDNGQANILKKDSEKHLKHQLSQIVNFLHEQQKKNKPLIEMIQQKNHNLSQAQSKSNQFFQKNLN